jgi:hypothetical protein
MLILAVHAPSAFEATLVSDNPVPTVTTMFSLALNPAPLTLKEVPGGPLERSMIKSAPIVRLTSGTLATEVRDPELWML